MKGYVKKRKDGRYEGRIELPPDPITGKRRQKYVYANGSKECWRLVNEEIYKLQTGNFTDAGRLTVDAYMTKWLNTYCEKLAASTKQGYKNYIENHINVYFKDFKIKNLKPIHIEEFYNYERKKYSEKTVLQIHRIFSRALKDAVKNSLISKNPCNLVDAPSPCEYEADIPTIETYFKIVDAAADTEHEIPVLLAGGCGLRREEVFGLTWNDIDFENSTITIRQVVTTAEKHLDIKAPKTKKSARTISIDEDLLAVLQKHKGVGYVASINGDIIHPGNYSHRFNSFLKKNNLPHIRFHDLRHYHATLLMEANIPLKQAQARLGHSNVNMVMHYQHVRPKGDAMVVTKINDYLRGSIRGSANN